MIIFLAEYISSNSDSRKKAIEEVLAYAAYDFLECLLEEGGLELYKRRFNGQMARLEEIAKEAFSTCNRAKTRAFLEEGVLGEHAKLFDKMDYCIVRFVRRLHKNHSF